MHSSRFARNSADCASEWYDIFHAGAALEITLNAREVHHREVTEVGQLPVNRRCDQAAANDRFRVAEYSKACQDGSHSTAGLATMREWVNSVNTMPSGEGTWILAPPSSSSCSGTFLRLCPCNRARVVDALLASRRGRSAIHSSPISSLQTSGCSATYLASIWTHSFEWASNTSVPFSRSQSMPPRKFTDSPTTTVPMPNWRIRPLQYQHGASVVTMILSR